uniref:Short-chain dehydrogenase/reductase family 16C member 6 n=1 Tax=Parastrongyloides trichosuri TaxID=131310 RepID=A0A0N4ZSI9_PARTI
MVEKDYSFDIVEEIVEFFKVLLLSIYYILVGCVKALLPSHVLPRKNVENEIVLITGAGSGIGRLMAKEFGKLKAKIVIWDINEKGAKETVEMLKKNNVKCWSYKVDVSKKEEIYEAANKVKKEIGDVDILINNAGIVTGKKIFDCDDNLMELTMAVNTTSHFFTTKAFLPTMLKNNHGHIVSIASLAGKFGITGLVDYCASKFGAVGFSEALSEELLALNKDNVHVTTICPYYIDTKMFDGVITKSPTLLPILEPEYVVDKIMEAILTNTDYLYLPKFSYLANVLNALIPVKAMRVLSNYFGINATMDHFTGRKKVD